jgi:transposase
MVIPRIPIVIAINYTLKIEKGLRLYSTDGMLSIDNNVTERQIRTIAFGRRNFMFAGSPNGARNAAIAYSFIATCRMHRINPVECLEDVLNRITDHPVEKLYELLPQYWKRPFVANTG